MKKFADIHIHSTLKPFSFYSAKEDDPRGSIWFQDKPTKRQRDNDMVRYTQSDFTTLAQSGIKIIYAALYPMEQGWVASFDTGIVVDFLAHLYTQFPTERINQIQSENYNYFNEVQKEYVYLKNQISEPHFVEIDGETKLIYAKIPLSIEDYNQYMSEENTIIVIPTIEGANSLISSNAENIDDFNLYQTLNNIQTVKNWPNPPFFVTLCHHFYNGICGHAKSIYPKNQIQENIQKILLRQSDGLYADVTTKGEKVIKSLLGIGEYNGSGRILIDIKHMNVRSRNTLYEYIRTHNEQNTEDTIPIIASHVAYSGIKTFNELKQQDATNNKYFELSEDYFNEAKINLCDEDIFEIYNSNGLIGINIDERILSNKKVIDTADQNFNYKATDELRTYWAEQIVRNISSMAKAVFQNPEIKDKSYVWEMFCIGSDFDGFINPVDAFITTNDYIYLEEFLVKAFENDNIFKSNTNENSAQKLVRKIMFDNAEQFLVKHYFNKQTTSEA